MDKLRQSSFKVSGTIHSIGDRGLTIYNNSICRSNAVVTEQPWPHPRKVCQVDS